MDYAQAHFQKMYVHVHSLKIHVLEWGLGVSSDPGNWHSRRRASARLSQLGFRSGPRQLARVSAWPSSIADRSSQGHVFRCKHAESEPDISVAKIHPLTVSKPTSCSHLSTRTFTIVATPCLYSSTLDQFGFSNHHFSGR